MRMHQNLLQHMKHSHHSESCTRTPTSLWHYKSSARISSLYSWLGRWWTMQEITCFITSQLFSKGEFFIPYIRQFRFSSLLMARCSPQLSVPIVLLRGTLAVAVSGYQNKRWLLHSDQRQSYSLTVDSWLSLIPNLNNFPLCQKIDTSLPTIFWEETILSQ